MNRVLHNYSKRWTDVGKNSLDGVKKGFRSVFQDLEQKKRQLQQGEKIASHGGDTSRMRQLEQEINLLLDKESKMWSQRSRIMWLKDED